MKIKEIEIKGWRSFDNTNGITLKDLKRINIFIGPNNSGKSNIGKYFLSLKNILSSKKMDFHKPLYEQYALYNWISKEILVSDTWAWLGEDISCTITLNCQKSKWLVEEPICPIDKTKNLKLKALYLVKQKENIFSLLTDKNQTHLDISKKVEYPQVLQYTRRHSDHYVDYNKDIKGLCDSLIYWSEFYESLVFIDPLRHYERQPNGVKNEFYFEGSETKSKLFHIRDNQQALWLDFEQRINLWLKELLNETIDFRLERDIQFRIYRQAKLITANLEQVGTGVAQLFMLLSYLYINQERELNVFIDEPEANLHPEAVKKLVRIFEVDFPNHSFFITTHSSVLIDQINDNWSIHRVIRKNEVPTEILPCNLIIRKYEALDDLGIRASQLLQTNLIIWVEGPSDRIYIKKWIEIILDEQNKDKNQTVKFEESKHFSFLMYGGSNLNSHTILSDNSEYIDILSTSRYSLIVCDSDYKTSTEATEDNLKPRVKKVLKQLQTAKSQEIGVNKQLDDYVQFWITEGRETENYIPKELFVEILSESQFKREYIIENKTRKNLEIDKTLIDTQDFNKYDAFDYFFSKMYKFDDNSDLTDEQRKNIAVSISDKKVEISRKIVEKWNTTHTSVTLKKQIITIIDFIKTANGL
jgi:AAA15 family ATPase/GTPase